MSMRSCKGGRQPIHPDPLSVQMKELHKEGMLQKLRSVQPLERAVQQASLALNSRIRRMVCCLMMSKITRHICSTCILWQASLADPHLKQGTAVLAHLSQRSKEGAVHTYVHASAALSDSTVCWLPDMLPRSGLIIASNEPGSVACLGSFIRKCRPFASNALRSLRSDLASPATVTMMMQCGVPDFDLEAQKRADRQSRKRSTEGQAPSGSTKSKRKASQLATVAEDNSASEQGPAASKRKARAYVVLPLAKTPCQGHSMPLHGHCDVGVWAVEPGVHASQCCL